MTNTINYIAYAIGFISIIWFISSQGFSPKKIKSRMVFMQRSRQRDIISNLLEKRIFRRYHFLLSSSLRWYQQEFFVNILVWQTIFTISTFFFTFFISTEVFFSLIIMLLIGIIFPITLLMMVHKRRQYNIQDYLDDAIIMLLQEYEKNETNMLYTLKAVSQNLDGPLRIIFSKLFARMHSTKQDKILATETFAFQLGYTRGKILATVILRSILDKDNVISILKDLSLQISEFQKKFRDAKSEAGETVLIGYFTIVALITLTIFNFWLIGGDMMAERSAYYYSFVNPESFKWFVITAIIGLFNIALVIILQRPKKGI